MTIGLSSTVLLGGLTPAFIEAAAKETAYSMAALESTDVNSAFVAFKKRIKETDYMNIHISQPVVKGLTDKKFEKKINQEIDKKINILIEELQKEAQNEAKEAKKAGYKFHKYELIVQSDAKYAGPFLSIVMTTNIYSGGANDNTTVASVNIVDGKQGKQIHLNELVKDNKGLNNLILHEIEKSQEEFFTGEFGFQSFREEQPFYIENGQLGIIFDKYEIAPGVMGTPIIQLPISEVKPLFQQKYADLIVGLDQKEPLKVEVNGTPIAGYVKKEGLKSVPMVALQDLAVHLGYELKSNQEEQTYELQKSNRWTSVKVGENRYFYGRITPFQLEAAPEIFEKKVYVPVSFAEKVLEANVTTNKHHDIEILAVR